MTGNQNPDFQLLMLPMLECLKDETLHSMDYVQDQMQRYIEYSDARLKQFDPDKNALQFESGIASALIHLVKAGLVERSSQNQIRITSLGKLVMSKRLNVLDINYLRRFPGYTDGQ